MSDSMSDTHTQYLSVEYRFTPPWRVEMMPWHRQAISFVYGVGVIMIALLALEQGHGKWVILGVVGMSMLTLMLIFGVEIERVQIGRIGRIEFADRNDSSNDDPTLAEAEEVIKEAEEDE